MNTGRKALLDQAAIEAARQFMSGYLRRERDPDCMSARTPDPAELDGYLQDLRDALSAQGRARKAVGP